MDIEAVYSRLPGFAQNLACTYEGFRIQKRRYNREFRRLLSRFVISSLHSGRIATEQRV